MKSGIWSVDLLNSLFNSKYLHPLDAILPIMSLNHNLIWYTTGFTASVPLSQRTALTNFTDRLDTIHCTEVHGPFTGGPFKLVQGKSLSLPVIKPSSLQWHILIYSNKAEQFRWKSSHGALFFCADWPDQEYQLLMNMSECLCIIHYCKNLRGICA